MGSGNSGLYSNTIGSRSVNMGNAVQNLKAKQSKGNASFSDYRSVISKLPKNPNELSAYGWQDITNPTKKQNRPNSMDFKEPNTGLIVHFDKGEKDAPGNRGKDHYHVINPDRTGKNDYYLDVNGKPCAKGSAASHISPKEGGNK